MNFSNNARHGSSERGIGGLGILFFFILLIFLIIMFDMGYIFLSKECMDTSPIECALNILTGEDEAPPEEGSVTATGVISREYKGENRSVTVSLNIPLEGGAVTGSFTGDCDGNITGTYAGGESGAISGKGSGSCAFIIPASGSFSGVVNKSAKTVPVSGTGSAAGISGEGSLTLTY